MPTTQRKSSFRKMLIVSCLALALLGSSCGGGSSSPDSSPTPPTSQTATLVVVVSDVTPPVSVSLDGQVLVQGLPGKSSTSPLIVASGQHQLLVQDSTGPLGDPHQTPLPLDLAANSHTTVYFGANCVFGGSAFTFTDDTTPASGSMAKLRIINGGCYLAPVNIYVVPFGSGPTGDPQIANSLGQGEPTYLTFAPGDYDVYFVTAQMSGGPPPTVLYHTGSLSLGANQNRSLYFFAACTVPLTSNGCSQPGFASVTVADLN
jgi:Domain of unknown function (DUF4397)